MRHSEPTGDVEPSAEPRHVPVMVEEVLHWLEAKPGALVVDGTLGAGGHAARIAQQLGRRGHLIGLDRDPQMLSLARSRIDGCKITLMRASFDELRNLLDDLNVPAVDGVLLDLGICSDQLAAEGRGFSFHDPASLDLRFDRSQGEPAHRLVNRLSCDRLSRLFWEFGEERYSRRIASAVVRARRNHEIETSAALAEIVRRAVPGPARRGRIHPATRVFQALRIAVNNELEIIARALQRMPECLAAGGRLVAISFHSLEDRIVKQTLREHAVWDVLTRRPVRPTEVETSLNPRARSAKLRAACKR